MGEIVRARLGVQASDVTTKSIYQWDHGLMLEIEGQPDLQDLQVHFGNDVTKEAINVLFERDSNGVHVGPVPDALTSMDRNIDAYVYYESEETGYTVRKIVIPLIPRQKPDAISLGIPQIDNLSKQVRTINTISPDKNGNITLDAGAVGAMPDTYTPPVTKVNGLTGDVDNLATAVRKDEGGSNDRFNLFKRDCGYGANIYKDGRITVFDGDNNVATVYSTANKPTPADIGALKLYGASDFNTTSLAEIYRQLPANSIFMADTAGAYFANQDNGLPYEYGMVTIFSGSTYRKWMNWTATYSSNGVLGQLAHEFRAIVPQSNSTVIEWARIYNSKQPPSASDVNAIPNTTKVIKTINGNNPDENGDFKPTIYKNLLKNSNFLNPVNQRGLSSYSLSNKEIFDCWIMSAGTVHIGSDGVTLIATSSAACVLTQYIPLADGDYCFVGRIHGKLVYYNFNLRGGTVTDGNKDNTYPSGTSLGYVQILYNSTQGTPQISIRANAGKSIVAEWAALYAGNFTSSNLPVYIPAGYADELMECRRTKTIYAMDETWALPFTTGFTQSRYARFQLELPTPMRINKPTIQFENLGAVKIILCDGTTRTITSVNIVDTIGNKLYFTYAIPSSEGANFPTGPCILSITGSSTGGYVIIDASTPNVTGSGGGPGEGGDVGDDDGEGGMTDIS